MWDVISRRHFRPQYWSGRAHSAGQRCSAGHQWRLNCNGHIIYKWAVFHSYVELPEVTATKIEISAIVFSFTVSLLYISLPCSLCPKCPWSFLSQCQGEAITALWTSSRLGPIVPMPMQVLKLLVGTLVLVSHVSGKLLCVLDCTC
jgi:hypothetical protein